MYFPPAEKGAARQFVNYQPCLPACPVFAVRTAPPHLHPSEIFCGLAQIARIMVECEADSSSPCASAKWQRSTVTDLTGLECIPRGSNPFELPVIGLVNVPEDIGPDSLVADPGPGSESPRLHQYVADQLKLPLRHPHSVMNRLPEKTH
ncbi:MAG: hypothetical protein IPP63_20630 [Chloracidobacterium sp.]|nr:hypothetical protein [Chloracidobacterium sp.]